MDNSILLHLGTLVSIIIILIVFLGTLVLITSFVWCSFQLYSYRPIADKPMEKIVRLIPSRFDTIPRGMISADITHTIYPHIYLTKKEFKAFKDKKQTVWQQSVMVHERIHLQQQEDRHPLREGLGYLCSKQYRLESELEAIQAQMDYLHAHGTEYDYVTKAQQFSSKTYGFMLDYQSSIDILKHLWETRKIITHVAVSNKSFISTLGGKTDQR